MARFFSNENWIWKPFAYIADLFVLSCMWVLCSIPILTMGAATTALYDCCVRCVRGTDQQLFARFFRTAKREFVPAALSMLLWTAVIGGGYWLIRSYGNAVAVTNGSVILTTALLLLLTVVVGAGCWVLPLLSRFTFDLVQLNVTALKLAFSHMGRTLLLGLCTVGAGYVCIRFWLPVMVLPALVMLVWSVLLEPVFRSYMEPEAEE